MRKRLCYLASITVIFSLLLVSVVGCAPKPAEFEVVSLDVTPSEMTVGETATIKAQVENSGGSEDIYTAILTVDGVKVGEKDVTVAAGATMAVTFFLVKDTPGSYQISIGGLSSTLTVEKTAKIEISFNPNPVPCKDGHWYWRVILTEVNGIGVKLNKLTTEIYQSKRLLGTRDYDSSMIQEWLDSAYLPASSSADFGASFPCQAITHEIVTVTGTDDNGHEITATGRVDFLPQVELKYDDGKPEGRWAIGGPGWGYLVQFSPPSRPFTINKIKIFGNLYGTGYEKRTFTIQVWDKDLKEIYSVSYPHTKIGLSPGWVEIEIPDLIVDDNFYIQVCTYTPEEGGIQIFYDSNVKNKHSEVTKNWTIADWYLRISKEKVNWMIRVLGTITVPAD